MENKIIINKLKIFAVALVLFASCQYETIEVDTCSDVSFADNIQKIFDDRCVSCHSGSTASSGLDLSPGNSYTNLIDKSIVNMDAPEESKLYTHAKSGHKGATPEDACNILGWIVEGANEGEPLIDSVFYNEDIQPIFVDHCMKCHITGHSSNLDLTPNKSYASLIASSHIDLTTPSNSTLYSVLNDGHLDDATSEDYATILDWIEQGGLEPEEEYFVASVNYDAVLAIFTANCIECHNETQLDGGIDLTSSNAYQYISDSSLVDTLNPVASLMYTTLLNGHHDNATGIEYWIILTWIEDGAPVVIPPVSFANEIQPIFESAHTCTMCHNTSNSSGNLDLSTDNAYTSLQGNTNSSVPFIDLANPELSPIYLAPLSTGSHVQKYTEDEAAVVLKWIEEGANYNK